MTDDRWKRLRLSSWGKKSMPPIEYREWVDIAAGDPEQDLAWRDHEYYGRVDERHRRAFEEVFDMGGEG